MRIAMLIIIPEDVEVESYTKGIMNGLTSFFPLTVQDVVLLDEIPQHLKDKTEGFTFSERGGKTYAKLACQDHDHPALEVRVLEVVTTSLQRPDVSEQMSTVFNGGPPKVYEA